MPLRTLVQNLSPPAPPSAREGADGSYRDFLVVALMLKREKLFPDNWIYIHTPGVKVGRAPVVEILDAPHLHARVWM